MKRLSFFTVVLVFGLTLALVTIYPVQAATFYVDDHNCPGPGTGTPGDPFCKIQDGIDAAVNSDTVQVAPGTYDENISMKSGVLIQGAGAGDDPSIHSIIDGGASGSVVTAIGVDSAAKLDGFKITNGKEFNGGGMYNEGSSPAVSNCTFSGNSAFFVVSVGDGGGMYNWNSSPTVTNCTFSGNDAHGNGGGMHNVNSSPTVTNCTFSDNTAYQGGGMYNLISSPAVTNCTFSGNSSADPAWGGGMVNEDSSPTVSKCSFLNNHSGTFGGGMYNHDNSSPIVTSCIFSGNSAWVGGGGMSNLNSSPTVTNCIFSQNSGSDGGGVYNRSSSHTVTNCTFSKNSGSYGGGIYNESNSSVTVTNSILWGDNTIVEIYNSDTSSCSATYSDIQWVTYPGTGNIKADPMFVDEAGGDLHLQPGSPCIDAGDNSAPALPATDIDGDDRKIDDPTVADTGNGTPPIVDVGADEYGPSTPACECDFDDDGDVDDSDLVVFATDFGRTDCATGDPCEGDFNDDNDLDGSELAIFVEDFERTDCP
jgi:parallel beta-helix repeat protein